ncbi:S-adenosylmethionine decarboxylase [Phosphitispora fastidiosa]|uniref:S-adenosylmethionine decarboxylase n=1 Tax=Phosphitispora fastidiosa TaxID=2837202 RepID=UPI001E31E950|nr:S-adenosylmethionine decarboxylase [Phosphitispora fastidiosa]MBU7007946.1 S-adenosylmethionine/arginine decarboxylase-like enzyme [Phosphitispora fastidiosa]
MNHFVMDAFNGYRSRLDDITLVHEFLEEMPVKLGLKTAMPPFILPYYNGVIPEDCGISAFVFLAGGHFTIHTFSFREAYYVDMVSVEPFDAEKLERIIRETFPAERTSSYLLERERTESYPETIEVNEELDFGPHLFLDFEDYNGPKTMDQLFSVFDTLPFEIGMTPIMRPYVTRNFVEGEPVTSIMTMIAESHISLHYFEKTGRAYLDLFSCRFFDYEEVIGKLKQVFHSNVVNETLISRGSKYHQFKKVAAPQAWDAGSWVRNVYRRQSAQ